MPGVFQIHRYLRRPDARGGSMGHEVVSRAIGKRIRIFALSVEICQQNVACPQGTMRPHARRYTVPKAAVASISHDIPHAIMRTSVGCVTERVPCWRSLY